MKKKFYAGVLFGVLILLSGFTVTSWATERSALENAAKVIIELNNRTNGRINWGTDSSDMKSLFLDQGETYTYSNYLYAGNTYFILAIGCDDATDVDITLYDENYNEVASDTTTDSWGNVAVTPRWSGKFYIKIEMYKAVGGAAHVVTLTGHI